MSVTSRQPFKSDRWWLGFIAMSILALASAGAVASQNTPLQLKPSSKFDGWQVALKAVLIGAMGLVVAGGGLFAYRTWQRSKGITVGEVAPASVEWARRVSPRTTLVIVHWNGKRYLLAEGAAHITLIDTQVPTEPPA
jgi:hypothetical protein